MIFGIGALFLVSYAVALTVTAPARLIDRVVPRPDGVIALSGTLWSGEALLEGGFRASWQVDPLGSLGSASLALDWALAGPATELTGRARLVPDRVTAGAIEGRTGWALVAAALPALEFACDMEARVALERLVIAPAQAGAAGEVRSGPALCARREGSSEGAIALPALVAAARVEDGATLLEVTAAANPATLLAEARLTPDGTLAMTLHPEGARLFPDMPTSGPSTLEMQLF